MGAHRHRTRTAARHVGPCSRAPSPAAVLPDSPLAVSVTSLTPSRSLARRCDVEAEPPTTLATLLFTLSMVGTVPIGVAAATLGSVRSRRPRARIGRSRRPRQTRERSSKRGRGLREGAPVRLCPAPSSPSPRALMYAWRRAERARSYARVPLCVCAVPAHGLSVCDAYAHARARRLSVRRTHPTHTHVGCHFWSVSRSVCNGSISCMYGGPCNARARASPAAPREIKVKLKLHPTLRALYRHHYMP